MNFLKKIFNRKKLVNSSSGFDLSHILQKAEFDPIQAEQLTAVYACNRVLSETIATFSLKIYEQKSVHVKGIKRVIKQVSSHPLNKVLGFCVNPNLTSFAWREMLVRDLNYRGNHFAQIIRNKKGEVCELYPLIHDNMRVKTDENGRILYEYHVKEKSYILTPREILHIKGLLSDDAILGISPIEANKRALNFALETEEFGTTFYKNAAVSSGVFYKDGFLSDEAFNRLKKGIEQSYTGLKNYAKPMILEEGMKFQAMSITNSDAQFLETKKYQKTDIASIFRVPMHLINSLENATFTNIEHQSKEFIEYSILPWVKRISQQLELSLLTKDEQGRFSVEFNIESLLKGDYATRTQGYQTMLQNGIMSINEIRELENLNFIQGGDKHYIQLNMTDIENLGEQKAVK